MLLMENVAEVLSSFSQRYTIRTYTPDPTSDKQILIIKGGGRQIKGLDGSVQYTTMQIQVLHKDKRTAEISMENIINVLDGNTSIKGVEVCHWLGDTNYWTTDNGMHCFASEFVLIYGR